MSQRTNAVITRKARIVELNEEISKTRRKLERLQNEKRTLEGESIDFLKKEGLERISDDEHNISIRMQDVPVLQDFNEFWKFVSKKNHPELLMRKVNSTAWRDHDQNVPGVSAFCRETLSITKRR